MIIVKNKDLLDKYISTTGISRLFSQDISNLLELFSLEKGDFLINEGECSDYLFFLVNGKLKVFSHSTSGKIMSLSLFNSFQIIGETCSLWNKPPTASVQATCKTYCIGISMQYRDLLLNDILKSENNGIFSYNLTECAELLCTSYRHLLRIINLFCNTNKLSKNGKSYKIIDRGYLESIASNSIIT